MSLDAQVQTLADRLAITDVIIRYFELVDAKGWDQMDEVFTEDTTARWTPDSVMEGRDQHRRRHATHVGEQPRS